MSEVKDRADELEREREAARAQDGADDAAQPADALEEAPDEAHEPPKARTCCRC